MKLTPDELLEVVERTKGSLPDPELYPNDFYTVFFSRLNNDLGHLNVCLNITNHTVKFRKTKVISPYQGKGYLCHTWEFDGIE